MSAVTIYVVDDDPFVRRALERLLRTADYDVVVCESAAAFLSLPVVERPTCLVVDIRMPGVTGLDLQDRLSGDQRDLPVVFITGHRDDMLAARAMAGGAVAYLTKPLIYAELFRAVHAGVAVDAARLAAIHSER